MKPLHYLNVLSVAILFVLINESLSQSEPKGDNKQSEQTIVGAWRAKSISMLKEDGNKQSLPSLFSNTLYSVSISKDNLTIWKGAEKFAEMSYASDSKQDPCTIDGKFQNRDVLGIYKLKNDILTISLNDTNKSRPQNFNKKDNDTVLVLQPFQGQPLMVINTDDNKLSPLLSMPEYTTCGSPNFSSDGSKIAFDAWRSLLGVSYNASHVFIVNADGSEPKDLGDGALPSFSPDGNRFAYTRYNPNNGVWTMNADGSDKKLIDPQGWCARWSPKGDQLAFISQGMNPNLCIFDLNTNKSRNLLDKKYSQVYWGLCWSPDAKWICFKGDLPEGSSEVAMVHVEGQAKGFKVLLPSDVNPGLRNIESSLSWSPDSKMILVSGTLEGDRNLQLYSLDPEGKTALKKLAGQDPDAQNYCSSWSPDGKRIVLAFWPANQAQNSQGGDNLLRRIFGM